MTVAGRRPSRTQNRARDALPVRRTAEPVALSRGQKVLASLDAAAAPGLGPTAITLAAAVDVS